MKILELNLKKDVLIVEIPRLADYEFINRECKYLKVGNEEIKLNASTLDKFEFLCKGLELKEETASELVDETIMYEKHKVKCYRYRSYIEGFVGFKFAKEAVISAVESKGFYWGQNPINHKNGYKSSSETYKQWQEAEEKTFRNPLIFVKKENLK